MICDDEKIIVKHDIINRTFQIIVISTCVKLMFKKQNFLVFAKFPIFKKTNISSNSWHFLIIWICLVNFISFKLSNDPKIHCVFFWSGSNPEFTWNLYLSLPFSIEIFYNNGQNWLHVNDKWKKKILNFYILHNQVDEVCQIWKLPLH